MRYLLIALALVALPTHAESDRERNKRISKEVREQLEECQQAMYKEFPYPEWRVFDDTVVGCNNPAICGSVWTSFSFNVRRNPAGGRMYVWCQHKDGEVTLSEKNPDGDTEEERFSVPQ